MCKTSRKLIWSSRMFQWKRSNCVCWRNQTVSPNCHVSSGTKLCHVTVCVKCLHFRRYKKCFVVQPLLVIVTSWVEGSIFNVAQLQEKVSVQSFYLHIERLECSLLALQYCTEWCPFKGDLFQRVLPSLVDVDGCLVPWVLVAKMWDLWDWDYLLPPRFYVY